MKLRDAALKAYRDRVARISQRLLSAELSVALGCSYLYLAKTNEHGRTVHELVKDRETIRQFLDGELEGDGYYITTEKPDASAIRGILDRTFDRPAQRQVIEPAKPFVLPPGGIQFVFVKQDGADNRT